MKRCSPKIGCNKPRARFWKKSLGVDWFDHDSYSSALLATINYAVSNGITQPSSTVLAAMDTFIRARIADGSWDLIDRLWIPALNNSGLSAFGYLNHKSAGVDSLSPQSSPTYGAGGVKGNGTTSYFDTGFNPSTDGVNYALNSASFGCWVRTAPVTGFRIFGTLTGGENDLIYVDALNIHKINTTANLTGGSVTMTGLGYKAMNRTSSSAVQVYNGATKSDRTAASTALANANFCIDRTTSGFSDTEVSMAYVGASLSQAQHDNIRNDFQTYLTAIGL
jgi:hypothetical protein